MKTKARAVDNAWNDYSKLIFYSQGDAVYFERWQWWKRPSATRYVLRFQDAYRTTSDKIVQCSLSKMKIYRDRNGTRKRYLLCFHNYRSGFPWLQSLGCHVHQWIIPRAQGNRTTVDQVNDSLEQACQGFDIFALFRRNTGTTFGKNAISSVWLKVKIKEALQISWEQPSLYILLI